MFNSLFGKKKITVTVYFKSGNKTSFKCTDFRVKHTGDNITSYNAEGIDARQRDPLFWCALDQIELITIDR